MKKKKNKKPTTFEWLELIAILLTAVAAIIQAIKWWQTQARGSAPPPLGMTNYNIMQEKWVLKNEFFRDGCAHILVMSAQSAL